MWPGFFVKISNLSPQPIAIGFDMNIGSFRACKGQECYLSQKIVDQVVSCC